MILDLNARFASRALFILAAVSPFTALGASCSAQCAAACSAILDITIQNVDVGDAGAHTYVLTLTMPGSDTVTCTWLGSSQTMPCMPIEYAPYVDASLMDGRLQASWLGTPAQIDVLLTRDGAQVAYGSFMPTYDVPHDVCGDTCENGAITLTSSE